MKKIFLLVVFLFPLVSVAQSGSVSAENAVDVDFLSEITSTLNSERRIQPQAKKGDAVAAYTVLVKKVQKRKVALSDLAKKNPRIALKYVVKKEARNKQEAAIQSYIEEETKLSGTLEVMHIDDFKNQENSYHTYTLINGKQRTAIYSAKEILIRSGAKVRVSGYKLNNAELLTDGEKASIEVTQMPDIGALGKQRTLILLVNSVAQPVQPMTPEWAENNLNNGQFQKFVKEASYGQTWFEAKAYGWLTLSRTKYRETCGFADLSNSEVKAFIAQKNIRLSEYDRVIFYVPGGGGCSGVGKSNYDEGLFSGAYVGVERYAEDSGWGSQPFPWSNLDFILAHELGHSLGLPHANGFDCGNNILSGECRHVEYGNNYDAMGAGGRFSLHYNGFYKEILNWIKSPNIISISESGRYTIQSLEDTSGVAKKFAKVYIPSISSIDPSFALEFRNAVGFDSSIEIVSPKRKHSGLLVTVPKINRYEGGHMYAQSRLLDLHPSSESWYQDIEDAGIYQGETFSDPSFGVTFKNITTSLPKSMSFDVVLAAPKCVRGKPSAGRQHDQMRQISQGSYAGFSVEIFNSDSELCGESPLSITVEKMPAGWEMDTTEKLVSSKPRDAAYPYFSFKVSENSKIGLQAIEFRVVNTITGAQSEPIKVSYIILAAPKIHSFSPNPVKPGNEVVVKGEGFNPEYERVQLNNYNTGLYESLPATITENEAVFKVPTEVCRYEPGEIETKCIKTPLHDDLYEVIVQGHGTGAVGTLQILSSGNVGTSSLSRVEIPPDLETNNAYDISWIGKNLSYVNIEVMDSKGQKVLHTIAKNVKASENPALSKYWYPWGVPSDFPEDAYKIRVSDSLNQSVKALSSRFEVTKEKDPSGGVAEVIGQPKLSISYDSSRKESKISALYTVKVVPRKEGLMLYDIDTKLSRVPPIINLQSTWYRGATIQSAIGAKKMDGYYLLFKGIPAELTVRVDFEPSILFGGRYKGAVYGVYAVDASRKYTNMLVREVDTNTVTVVGETSAYIYQIKGGVYPGSKILIPGIRFDQFKNYVTFNSVRNPNPIPLSPIPTPAAGVFVGEGTIPFTLPTNISPGVYELFVSTDKGKSNSILIEVLRGNDRPDQAIPQPFVAPSVVVPTPVFTPTVTSTPIPTFTPTPSVTTTPTASPAPSTTQSPTASPSATPTSSPSPYPSSSPSPSPSQRSYFKNERTANVFSGVKDGLYRGVVNFFPWFK